MNILALLVVISVTAPASVGDWYLSRTTKWLRWDKSTHIRILSEFVGITAIGAHHGVASVTGVIMCCDSSK